MALLGAESVMGNNSILKHTLSVDRDLVPTGAGDIGLARTGECNKAGVRKQRRVSVDSFAISL